MSTPEVIAYQPKDAARVIGVGLTTLYSLIGEGKILAKKAGGRTLIPAHALHSYLDNLPDAEIVTGQPLADRESKRAKGFQSRQNTPV